MKHDLTPYKRKGKIALGDSMKIIFVHISNPNDYKALELTRVAGYFDKYDENETLQWLRVDDSVGTYGDDLAMRLKRPEVADFKEVFFFKDNKCVNLNFGAVAEKIEFRDWNENDKWLT